MPTSYTSKPTHNPYQHFNTADIIQIFSVSSTLLLIKQWNFPHFPLMFQANTSSTQCTTLLYFKSHNTRILELCITMQHNPLANPTFTLSHIHFTSHENSFVIHYSMKISFTFFLNHPQFLPQEPLLPCRSQSSSVQTVHLNFFIIFPNTFLLKL